MLSKQLAHGSRSVFWIRSWVLMHAACLPYPTSQAMYRNNKTML